MLGEWQEARLWHCAVCICHQCCGCRETVECNCFARYMHSCIYILTIAKPCISVEMIDIIGLAQ